jgi:hypothetical protein
VASAISSLLWERATPTWAFAYNEFNDCSIVKAHLRLLQLSSSGASNVLTILDAVPLASNSNFYFPDATGLGLGMIANADTGVVLTWGLDFVAGKLLFRRSMAWRSQPAPA